MNCHFLPRGPHNTVIKLDSWCFVMVCFSFIAEAETRAPSSYETNTFIPADTKSRVRRKTKIMQLIFTMAVSSSALLCFHDWSLVPKPEEYSQNDLL